MKNSKIAWTDHTFNPWWGCVKVSEGCKNCYASAFAKRTGQDVWGVDKPRRFFGEKHWREPLAWNTEAEKAGERRRVFCGSMMDVFETHANIVTHSDMNAARRKLADLIRATPWLDWLLLTKRIESAAMYLQTTMGFASIQPNVWLGAAIENAENLDQRIMALATTPAKVHFVSAEPLLESLGDLQLSGRNYGRHFPDWTERIDWVIVGGESGAGCRPFNPDWARSIRDQCKAEKVAFFMKQLGGAQKHRDQLADLPEDLRIREYPR